MEQYKTVKKQAEDEFIEKRSKFIGYCKPVTTEEEAIEFINEIKSMHWNATHNVYAYCLRENQIKRYSDDGEPQGTAGMPALDVILKNNVTDVVVVITRYFGGILLGGGGLVRAYSHSAKIALDAAEIITKEPCCICSLECNYNQYGKVSSLIPQMEGIIDESVFEENVMITFHISEDKVNAFNKELADISCGQIEAKITGKQYFTVKV